MKIVEQYEVLTHTKYQTYRLVFQWFDDNSGTCTPYHYCEFLKSMNNRVFNDTYDKNYDNKKKFYDTIKRYQKKLEK